MTPDSLWAWLKDGGLTAAAVLVCYLLIMRKLVGGAWADGQIAEANKRADAERERADKHIALERENARRWENRCLNMIQHVLNADSLLDQSIEVAEKLSSSTTPGSLSSRENQT